MGCSCTFCCFWSWVLRCELHEYDNDPVTKNRSLIWSRNVQIIDFEIFGHVGWLAARFVCRLKQRRSTAMPTKLSQTLRWEIVDGTWDQAHKLHKPKRSWLLWNVSTPPFPLFPPEDDISRACPQLRCMMFVVVGLVGFASVTDLRSCGAGIVRCVRWVGESRWNLIQITLTNILSQSRVKFPL